MRGIVLTVLIGIITEHRRSVEATEIICPPAQTCSTSVMNVTCSIKNFGLAWKASSFGYTELFTGNDPAGTIETDGAFTAVLNHTTPAKSSLFITPDPSMEGLVVKCIDGITADSKSCLLSVITLPGKPMNLTVTHITDTSVSLKWHPPKHTGGSDIQIIRYETTVSIETAHDTNEILTQQHNGNETSATISGLQNGTIHNFTMHAYNCLGEAGESTPTLTVTPGNSMIQVYPAEPSKQFISNSSVEVYWNTSAHSPDSAVKDYILHITKNGTGKEELQTGSTNQTYYFSNLLRGIQYFLTVAAVDTDNRVGKMSEPIHVLLDVPRKVDYLNCSITRTQNEFGVYSFFLEVQSMHSASILPPVEKFKISHNVTKTGIFISIVVAVNSTIIDYKTEVHLNNLNSAFLVLISAMNAFGEGEATLTDVQADLLTTPNESSKTTAGFGSNWIVILSMTLPTTATILIAVAIVLILFCHFKLKARLSGRNEGVEKSNMKTNSCDAKLVQVKKNPLFTTAPNPAYANQANLICHSTILVRPPKPQESNENNFYI